MSDVVGSAPPTRRRRLRWVPSLIAVVLAAGVLAGGFYFAVTRGVDLLAGQFAGPEDYEGPGRGSLTFEVKEGDSISAIGRSLKEQGVVASVDAFIEAAEDEPDSLGIQVGFYPLKRQMPAADALAVLIDPENLLKDTITIPEGLRVVDILDILVEKTDFSRQEFTEALAKRRAIGLPRFAPDNAEGYLFPATYDFGPNATPTTILKAMVDRWQQAAEQANLTQAAEDLGYSPAKVMIVASLVEAEASRAEDRGKVARVIYNRLETKGPPTFGKLEIDATVNYALGRNLGVALSEEDLAVDSPYNTRRYPGLPPGPIEAPGDAAIEAAANPTPGDWFFYVTVNLRTGETKFAETYQEFLRYREEYLAYCETSDAC